MKTDHGTTSANEERETLRSIAEHVCEREAASFDVGSLAMIRLIDKLPDELTGEECAAVLAAEIAHHEQGEPERGSLCPIDPSEPRLDLAARERVADLDRRLAKLREQQLSATRLSQEADQLSMVCLEDGTPVEGPITPKQNEARLEVQKQLSAVDEHSLIRGIEALTAERKRITAGQSMTVPAQVTWGFIGVHRAQLATRDVLNRGRAYLRSKSSQGAELAPSSARPTETPTPTVERADSDVSAAGSVTGVSLYDAAFHLEGDPVPAGALVKRWVDSKNPKLPKKIGKCPQDGRRKLSELSEVVEFVALAMSLEGREKQALRESLRHRVRSPRENFV